MQVLQRTPPKKLEFVANLKVAKPDPRRKLPVARKKRGRREAHGPRDALMETNLVYN
jgi:hypothetical protein